MVVWAMAAWGGVGMGLVVAVVVAEEVVVVVVAVGLVKVTFSSVALVGVGGAWVVAWPVVGRVAMGLAGHVLVMVAVCACPSVVGCAG